VRKSGRRLADDAKASREAQSARVRAWAERTAAATAARTPAADAAEGEEAGEGDEEVNLPEVDGLPTSALLGISQSKILYKSIS